MEVAAAAKAAGLEAQSFGAKLQGEASKLSVWALATTMIMGAVRAVKEMVENVKRLDMELIELKKVTDLTSIGYERMVDEAAVIARGIGAKLSDTIRAEADFARLGYDVNGEVQALAKTALVYKHVGDGIKDISEASESIISTMKAFGIEAENSMKIVDAFNEVGNKFAISSSGIGEAMQRSSASLAAANNTLEESIALTVGMNNVIQNPQIVGTALKTVSMYLRAAKADLEAAGESTEGMAVSTSKLRESILALTKQKVDIQLDENNFKSTYQVMKEISAVWADIADIDQAALLELLGGKRNATAVVSLLANFSDAERALEVAMNSAGSALQENEKWLAGIEGHISQFSAAFEDLSRKIVDSEMFKGLIDTGTLFIDVLIGITDGLDKVTGGLGGIPVAVAAITAAMGIMSKSGVKGGPFDFAPGDLSKAAEGIKAFGAHIKASVKDVGLFKTGLGEARGAMEGIKGVAQNAGASLQSFWTGFSNTPADMKALVGYAKELSTINEAQAAGLIDIKQNNMLAAEAYKTHIASVDGLKASTISTANAMKTGAVSAKQFAVGAGSIGVGAKAAAAGMKALSIAANMLFNMAIAAVITALITGIDKLIHHAEIAAEKAREAARAANEAATQSVDQYKSLVSLAGEYQKLSASGKINTADIEKARDLQNQIVQIVGRQVDGLDLVNGAGEEQVKLLREQLRLRAEDARIAATAAYSASVKATEKGQPLEKGFLGLYKGAYSSKHWASKDEQAARTALKNAKLWSEAYDNLRIGLIDEIMPGPAYTITLDFDMDGNKLDTVFKKISFLQEQIKALEADGNVDVTSNPVYLGLVQQVQAFEAIAAPNIEASVRLLESVATAAELASGDSMAAVKNLAEYTAERDRLISEIAGSASLKGPLESGAIELSRVEAAVDSILARNLPEWFEASRQAASESTAAFVDASAVIDNLGDSIDRISKRQKILQAAMADMGNPSGSGGISADTVKSIQDALTANEKLTDYITAQNGVLKLNAEAWNARTFGDIQSQIGQLQAANKALEEQNAQFIANSGAADILDLFSGKYAETSKRIEENTAKIQENQQALEMYQAIYDQMAMVDVWDFANMANDLGSVQGAASGLISAMQQLREGTALTKAELAKLAIQYPELLSAANLFVDSSVAGQRRSTASSTA
jgi:TP901 family phage tail tape measure protein